MRIHDVATQLGVSTGWIRRQERAGIVPLAPRDRNGHRRYGAEDVERIRALLFSRSDVRPGRPGHS